jgi:hypothetical protein
MSANFYLDSTPEEVKNAKVRPFFQSSFSGKLGN